MLLFLAVSGVFLKTCQDSFVIYVKCHMQCQPVNELTAYFYADDMKRQQKNGHNGHAQAGFSERLVTVRKGRNLTQQAIADVVQCGISQLKRYELGSSQPTLDVFKRLAQTLRVSSDYLRVSG